MKAGQWPAPSACGGGVLKGGDTGELEPATAGTPSTRDANRAGTVAVGAAGDDVKHPVGS